MCEKVSDMRHHESFVLINTTNDLSFTTSPCPMNYLSILCVPATPQLAVAVYSISCYELQVFRGTIAPLKFAKGLMGLNAYALFLLLETAFLFGDSTPRITCHVADSIIHNDLCVKCTQPFISGALQGNCSHPPQDTDIEAPPSSCLEQVLSCPSSEEDLDKAKLSVGASYLNGRKLRVVSIERLPFVKVKDNKFSGVCFELFYTLQSKYNFSSHIFLPPDGNWGAKLANGSWNGMVGLVYTKNADIGVAGFSVTFERAKVVAFTSSFHQEPTGILIPPPTEGEKLSVLIRPLSGEVWMAVGMCLVTLAPAMYAMHIISLRIRGDHSSSNKSVFNIFVELLHFMIGSLVQESVISPVNKTTRFLVMLWWMMTIIMSNIYVAYLVSYLSAPRLFNAINSLEDLVHQNQIKWTFRKSSALESLFQSSNTMGVYKLVGDGVQKADLVQTDYEGAQKALTGKYAFIKEKSFLDVALGEDFEKTKRCRVTLAKETFFKVETALIVHKQSKILPVFNNGIDWSVTTGLMEKFKTMHWPHNSWCEDVASYISSTQPKETRKLDLEDFQGAYLLLFSGLILSICAFIGEKFLQLSRRCAVEVKDNLNEHGQQYLRTNL